MITYQYITYQDMIKANDYMFQQREEWAALLHHTAECITNRYEESLDLFGKVWADRDQMNLKVDKNKTPYVQIKALLGEKIMRSEEMHKIALDSDQMFSFEIVTAVNPNTINGIYIYTPIKLILKLKEIEVWIHRMDGACKIPMDGSNKTHIENSISGHIQTSVMLAIRAPK